MKSDKVIVLHNEKNGGYGAGNNTGVFYSNREYAVKDNRMKDYLVYEMKE